MINEYQSGKLIFKLYGDLEKQLSFVKEKLTEISQGNATLNFENNGDDFLVEIEKSGEDCLLFDKAVKTFINTFSDYIYANEKVDLATQAVRLLKLSGGYLCTAESFTGGAVANAIVKVSGASEVFYEGLVCYNTQSKIERLGVNPLTVKEHTVVSREVAFEMVKGLIESDKCNFAVATTGYASPTGDPQKPAGLCFIAVANETRAEVMRYHFSGTREQIIEKGVNCALLALIKLLK